MSRPKQQQQQLKALKDLIDDCDPNAIWSKLFRREFLKHGNPTRDQAGASYKGKMAKDRDRDRDRLAQSTSEVPPSWSTEKRHLVSMEELVNKLRTEELFIARCWARDIVGSLPSGIRTQNVLGHSFYLIGLETPVTNVLLVGYVVGVSCKQTQQGGRKLVEYTYHVDDGTAVVQCECTTYLGHEGHFYRPPMDDQDVERARLAFYETMRPSHADRATFKLGELVQVVGSLAEATWKGNGVNGNGRRVIVETIESLVNTNLEVEHHLIVRNLHAEVYPKTAKTKKILAAIREADRNEQIRQRALQELESDASSMAGGPLSDIETPVSSGASIKSESRSPVEKPTKPTKPARRPAPGRQTPKSLPPCNQTAEGFKTYIADYLLEKFVCKPPPADGAPADQRSLDTSMSSTGSRSSARRAALEAGPPNYPIAVTVAGLEESRHLKEFANILVEKEAAAAPNAMKVDPLPEIDEEDDPQVAGLLAKSTSAKYIRLPPNGVPTLESIRLAAERGTQGGNGVLVTSRPSSTSDSARYSTYIKSSQSTPQPKPSQQPKRSQQEEAEKKRVRHAEKKAPPSAAAHRLFQQMVRQLRMEGRIVLGQPEEDEMLLALAQKLVSGELSDSDDADSEGEGDRTPVQRGKRPLSRAQQDEKAARKRARKEEKKTERAQRKLNKARQAERDGVQSISRTRAPWEAQSSASSSSESSSSDSDSDRDSSAETPRPKGPRPNIVYRNPARVVLEPRTGVAPKKSPVKVAAKEEDIVKQLNPYIRVVPAVRKPAGTYDPDTFYFVTDALVGTKIYTLLKKEQEVADEARRNKQPKQRATTLQTTRISAFSITKEVEVDGSDEEDDDGVTEARLRSLLYRDERWAGVGRELTTISSAMEWLENLPGGRVERMSGAANSGLVLARKKGRSCATGKWQRG